MRLLTLGFGIACCFVVLGRAEAIHFDFSGASGTPGLDNAHDRRISGAELTRLDFTGLTNTSWARMLKIERSRRLAIPAEPSLDSAGFGDPDLGTGGSVNPISIAPEPITVAMVGGGLILLGMMRPKRRKR